MYNTSRFQSMKRFGYFFLFVLVLLSHSVRAQALLPSPRNMVNDSAHLFTPEENARIEGILRAYRDSTTREILVVTVNDFKGYDANSFATMLGNQWGVGQRDVDNGAIFLLRPGNMPAVALSHTAEEEWASVRNGYTTQNDPYFLYSFLSTIAEDSVLIASRATRPEGDYGEGYIATGRGMEGALPDILAARVMRSVVAPFFVAHRYAEGTEAGLYAIFQTLAGDTTTISEILTTNTQEEEGSLLELFGILLLAYVILGLVGAFISIFFHSLGHAIKYATSKDLRSRYSFIHYWGRESWKSAKNVMKRLPSLMLTILVSVLLRGSSGSSSKGGSSRSSSFSGGGGSFGGGGGGSRF